jgi:hypothetical protein
MLVFLADQHAASERKLRLFCCACFRRVWYALTNQRARKAVEVAVRYADDVADDVEREAALAETASVGRFGVAAVKWAVVASARTGAMMDVDVAGQTAACPSGQGYDPDRWEAEWHGQCDLLRDLFGPLLFRPVRTDPAWLTWNGRTVRKLAEAAYAERSLPAGTLDSQRLAVLADALEDAGCTGSDLLGHLREPGPHVRGCFTLDLLLGKQ